MLLTESGYPGAEEAVTGAQPSVVILDPSAFNRNCIAAGLSLLGVTEIIACNRLDDVPPGTDCQLTLLSSDQSPNATALLNAQLKEAGKRWPDAGLLLLLSSEDLLAVAHKLESLPSIMLADVEADALIAAMRLIRNGHRVLPAGLLRDMADGSRQKMVSSSDRDTHCDQITVDAGTSRQRDVMRLLLMGLSNKTIAQRLNITESTVKVHVRAIMNMLNVENRTQIVARLMGAPGAPPRETRLDHDA